MRQRRRERPQPVAAVLARALVLAVVGVGAAEQPGVDALGVLGRPRGLRAPAAVGALDGDGRVGVGRRVRRRQAAHVAVVEAHDLVEPAGAAHLEAALAVDLVAADVVERPEPRALGAVDGVEHVERAVGLGVALEEALGEQQRRGRAVHARDEVARLPELRVLAVVERLVADVEGVAAGAVAVGRVAVEWYSGESLGAPGAASIALNRVGVATLFEKRTPLVYR